MQSTKLEGPAYGPYVDADEEYIRGQAGSVGSGLLGGWMQSNLGGPFGTGDSQAVAEVLRELKELRRQARERGERERDAR